MSLSGSGQPQHEAPGNHMSDELLAVLRYRVATAYYDQPHILAAIARAVARMSTS